jgi:hypothetical protein
MKYLETQWKQLEEEGAQVCEGKKWLLLNGKTDEHILMRRDRMKL